MKVAALSADEGGCQFYRMAEPARVARDLGVDIEVGHLLDVNAEQNKSTGIVTVHEIYTDADLIIIQRPLDNAFTSMIQQAKRQGIATIVELDDDFENISPRNIAYTPINKDTHYGPHWVRAAAEIADHVTVSTPALQRYALHGRSTVLRNCVPRSIFDIKKTSSGDSPIIGWTGTVQTHPDDLQVTKGAVAEVAKNNGLSVGIVGDGRQVRSLLRLGPETEMTATGWMPREDYYQTMADTMDIGIVPLETSPFNQAKSALKGLEMAALGIPFVASATREYELAEVCGIGKTAKAPGDWRRQLQRMLDRPAETEKITEEYQDLIYNGYTYEVNATDWIDVWEQTIAYRKSHNA